MVKSLDDVIARLQYKADNIKAKLEPSYFTECIDYLKSIPRCDDGWIPCSERLPENDDEVLCWYECRAINGTHAGEMIQMCDVGWYSKHFNHWRGEPTVRKDSKVLAWQPLPKPYVKGE